MKSPPRASRCCDGSPRSIGELQSFGNAPRRGLWLILAVVLLIRVPFLNQAIQGDDDIYITEAAHAQIDPLHPANTHYIFRGDDVDLRGQSHPPLNAWPLALLVAIFGDVKEIPFHAAYIVFSLIAAWSMWSLARRFSPHPVWATLLFLAVPAFVVNGNSFEPDVPFLAFWMASMALFCSGRIWLAAAAMALGVARGLSGRLPDAGAARILFATPLSRAATVDEGARFPYPHPPPRPRSLSKSSNAFPPALSPPPFSPATSRTTASRPLANKLRNAAALAIHFCFIVCPALLPGRRHPRMAPPPRSRYPVPAGMDRHLLRGRGNRILRRIRALPAAHRRAGSVAGVAPAATLARRRLRVPDGAQSGLGRYELSTLERLSPVRRVPSRQDRRPSRLGGWRLGLSLLPDRARRPAAIQDANPPPRRHRRIERTQSLRRYSRQSHHHRAIRDSFLHSIAHYRPWLAFRIFVLLGRPLAVRHLHRTHRPHPRRDDRRAPRHPRIPAHESAGSRRSDRQRHLRRSLDGPQRRGRAEESARSAQAAGRVLHAQRIAAAHRATAARWPRSGFADLVRSRAPTSWNRRRYSQRAPPPPSKSTSIIPFSLPATPASWESC